MEGRRIFIPAGVAADEVEGANGYVKLIVVRIFKEQKLGVMTVDSQYFESYVPANSVLKVNNGEPWS